MDAQAELNNLYQLNKEHLSNIAFLNDEEKVINQLLHKIFPSMMKDIYVNRIQLINRELSGLAMVQTNVIRDIRNHQKDLSIATNPLLAKSVALLKLQNSRIEDELKDLRKCIKRLKREVLSAFKLIPITNSQETECLL